MGRIAKELCIEFWVRDPTLKTLKKSVRGGRKFDIGGVTLKLFPISVMAEAIDRTPRTVVDWERDKKFPLPMYVVPGTHYKRWYSEAQILRANELWLRYRERGKARHFPVDDFLRELGQMFYTADINVIQQKAVSPQ